MYIESAAYDLIKCLHGVRLHAAVCLLIMILAICMYVCMAAPLDAIHHLLQQQQQNLV